LLIYYQKLFIIRVELVDCPNKVIWSCDVLLLQLLFVLLTLHLHTMPKKSWASEEQQTWLIAQLADFRQAQEGKTTPSFFTDLYEKFHTKWPVAAPNANDISEADGNEEKAKTFKQKASENVGGY